MLTDEQKERIRALCLSLVGEKYVLGAEVDLAKILPEMTSEEVCQEVKAIDCSEAVQVVFKWATGIEVIDLAARQFDESLAIEKVGRMDPEVGDLGFKRLEGKIGHVGIFIGEGKVFEARGKDYGCILRDAKIGWESQSVFVGWRCLRAFCG